MRDSDCFPNGTPPKARTGPAETAIKRQIAARDKQIDQLIYELHGLTDVEIKIAKGDGKS